jgi:type IV pilus assembly protein PilB
LRSKKNSQVIRCVDDLSKALQQMQPHPERLLGSLLLDDGVITEAQLSEALGHQKEEPELRIGQLLEEHAGVDASHVAIALGRKFGIPYVELEQFHIDPAVLTRVPLELALEYNVLPLGEIDGTVILAMENPLDWDARAAISFHANRYVEAVIASAKDISDTLGRYYDQHGVDDELAINPVWEDSSQLDEGQDAESQLPESQQRPIVRMLNAILLQAVSHNASDINIRPEKGRVNIYYRVDGKEQFIRSLNKAMLKPLVSRIKVTGRMNLAEHRLPQDGHARLNRGGKQIDLRISVIPTVMGESVVIRVLDTAVGLKPLEKIGFSSYDLRVLRGIMSRSNGMFLVTGPTGSGKSTTLYSALNEMRQKGPHIITVEDPVEYQIDGVEQIQVAPGRGYTFAEALRHILRHDPDVILVGEIRDQETARIANKAALTGHFVLSTLHTNDAASAVTRLLDMEVEPYLLSTTLLGSMAQRLLRVNCKHCLEDDPAPPSLRKALGVDDDEVFKRGTGCSACNNTGYKGRIAVCELLPVTEEIRALIAEGADAKRIRDRARRQGMKTLTQNALVLARKGLTSLEEVYFTRIN